MTHLSDFSYVDRAVSSFVLFPLILHFVFFEKKAHRDLLSSKKRRTYKRFLVLFFYILAYVLGTTYDIMSTNLKYSEGFVDTCLVRVENGTNETVVFRHPKEAFESIAMDPGQPFLYNGPLQINASYTNAGGCGIVTTPASLYDEGSLRILPTIDTLWNLQCTLRNSGIFLLLSFFNQQMRVFFKEPCLSRWESRLCTSYSFISLGSYFVLPQFIMSPLLSTISSQLLWSLELYFACCFLLVANWRITRLLNERLAHERKMSISGQSKLLESIAYIKSMNLVLAMVTLGEATGLFVLNMDILLVEWRVIYHSKLLTDVWTKVFNFFFIIEPLIVIAILYKPQFLHVKDVQRSTTAVAPSEARSFAPSSANNI